MQKPEMQYWLMLVDVLIVVTIKSAATVWCLDEKELVIRNCNTTKETDNATSWPL